MASEGFQIVITYPNPDAGGDAIIEALVRFHALGLPGVRLVKSLGRRRFHGLLHFMGVGRGVLAGNSSAGIKEARAFGCPCVNIGTRQRGRLRAGNVSDVDYDSGAIAAAIQRSVNDGAFRQLCATCENPYGHGDSGSRIAEALATVPIDAALLQKSMTY